MEERRRSKGSRYDEDRRKRVPPDTKPSSDDRANPIRATVM